jgi:hypothetical protein
MQDAKSRPNQLTVIAPLDTSARLLLPDGVTVAVVNGIATVDAQWKSMLVKNGWRIHGTPTADGSPQSITLGSTAQGS